MRQEIPTVRCSERWGHLECHVCQWAVVFLISILVVPSPMWAASEEATSKLAILCHEPQSGRDRLDSAGSAPGRQIATKLLRGLSNVTLGWAEFPKQVLCTWQDKGWLIGVTRGPIDGVGMLVARTLAGAFELVTFPVPIPPRYQPMLTPDHVWQPSDRDSAVH